MHQSDLLTSVPLQWLACSRPYEHNGNDWQSGRGHPLPGTGKCGWPISSLWRCADEHEQDEEQEYEEDQDSIRPSALYSSSSILILILILLPFRFVQICWAE